MKQLMVITLLFSSILYAEDMNSKPLVYEKALRSFGPGKLPSYKKIDNMLAKIPMRQATVALKNQRVPANDTNYLLEGIKTCNPNIAIPSFDRADWVKKWQVKPGDCQDTRQKVLIREHKQHRVLNFSNDKQCKVSKGFWEDMFNEKKFITNSKFAQVTHLVSLRNAHLSGGYKWSSEQKTLYANHFTDRDHLLIVHYQKNLERGGKHPGEFMPENKMFRCEYLGSWIKIKKDWNLCMTEDEKKSIDSLAKECAEAYDRALYVHWHDQDKDCLTTRNEILIRDSNINTKIERTIAANDQRKECKAVSGEWYDPFTYTDETEPAEGELNIPFLNALDLDVDHIVPLKNAHMNGGWAWPAWRKEEYANHTGDKNHLLAVSASENRKKGAKGPEDYMPPARKFKCTYLKIWTEIKSNWNLQMTEREKVSITNMLGDCKKGKIPN